MVKMFFNTTNTVILMTLGYLRIRPNNICHYIFPYYYLDIFFFFFECFKKKCPSNKKEIYNDKYRHTRDRLFGLP